jgi:hypothetical protein
MVQCRKMTHERGALGFFILNSISICKIKFKFLLAKFRSVVS